ncbi:MAG TPA: hypothetical protein VLS90_16605, partial [Thermodesulfobacteriota bacterium]|nr:hypothetical protein [Thermodesulfobacteriota bacterium]
GNSGPDLAPSFVRKALDESERVPDFFERQMIRTGAAQLRQRNAQGHSNLLAGIDDPYCISEVLAGGAGALLAADPDKALEAAGKIPLEPIRAKWLARVAGGKLEAEQKKVTPLYREILNAVPSISDPAERASILIELGSEWERVEKGREAEPFGMALKISEEVANPSSRTEVLERLRGLWKKAETNAAIRERTDPSAAAAGKTLEDVRLWVKTDPGKARALAETIPAAFPYERAAAWKEIAGQAQKTRSPAAQEFTESAWQECLNVPEGVRKDRLLSTLVSESAVWNKDWTLGKITQLPGGRTRDMALKDAGVAWAKESPAQALKAARQISDAAMRAAVYQKAADASLKIPGEAAAKDPMHPVLAAWGMARDKARKEETEARPFYEKAAAEIDKISDPAERAYLRVAMAVDFASIDERAALQVCRKISAEEFPAALSSGLLSIGGQLRKWSRPDSQTVFQEALSVTGKIKDPALRVSRLLQLAREWGAVDGKKGAEVLAVAERDADSAESRTLLSRQILSARLRLNPENAIALSRSAASPSDRARVLLEGARSIRERSIEPQLKILEKTSQSAAAEKNSRTMGESAAAWQGVNASKTLETLSLIEDKGARVETLLQIARRKDSPESARFYDQAVEESLEINGLTPKMELLREIGRGCSAVDRERAKGIYLKAYKLLDREHRSGAFPK